MIYSDLLAFTIRVLEEIDPDANYAHNWHLELMCDYLKEVYLGNIKRLIINVPPRSLKSVCISVAFPAWILANFPSEKIIAVSYSKILSQKHSLDCRKVLQSNWYKQITNTSIRYGENEKTKFTTMNNGYRFATSTNGTLTGEGGNVIIVDDPQNPAKIHSKNEREKVNRWFDSVLSSRLNDKNNGKIIVVMQRLHHEDLTAYLLGKSTSQWQVLSIPAIEEESRTYKLNNKSYIYRQNGDILHENRENIRAVRDVQNEMGSYIFAAQYQQKPLKESGVIDAKWFDFYAPESVTMDAIYYSVDTAFGTGKFNDYSVLMQIGEKDNIFYIMNIARERLTYPRLKKLILAKIATEKIHAMLIEDKNIGSSLIQEIKSQTNCSVISINPKQDKHTRVANCLNCFESKRVFIQENQEWNQSFLTEISTFPENSHDDQVDALTQFINWKMAHKTATKHPRLRSISLSID